jgi:hypothetical protein
MPRPAWTVILGLVLLHSAVVMTHTQHPANHWLEWEGLTNFVQGWPWTAILSISASQVVRSHCAHLNS